MACSTDVADKELCSNLYKHCGPCESRYLANNAVVWCQECDEGLCQECSEYHRVSKSSRNHIPLSVEVYMTLPSFVHTNALCSSHNESIDLFCGTHQEPCCGECAVLAHSTCKGVALLTKVVKGVKESEFSSTVAKNVTETMSSFASIIQNREENGSKLQQQKISLSEEVSHFRRQINNKLDELEFKILNEINETIDNEIVTMSEAKQEVKQSLRKLDEAQKNIVDILNHCTEVHTFLGLKYIEANLMNEKDKLSSQLNTRSMKEISFSIEISDELKHIISQLDVFGKIKTSFNDVQIVLPDIQPSQHAQMLKPNNNINDKIGLQHIKSIKLNLSFEKVNICSSVILEDGRIVLVDNNSVHNKGQLLIVDLIGSQSKVDFNTCPFGMALLNTDDLAVSFNQEECLCVYDTYDFTEKYRINTDYKHFGISLFGESDRIVTAVRGTGISVTDMSGKVLKIYPIDDPTLAYVHCTGDTILYTNYPDDLLHCMGIDGTKLWSCQFEDMKGPRNTCTDQFGNIFVASTDSNKVLLVSRNGTECKVLLTEDDGMSEPKAIYFDKRKSQLLVANRTGKTFLYNVEYQ